MPLPDATCRAQPSQPCRAGPGHTLPVQATPSLPHRALPGLAMPCLAEPAQPCPAARTGASLTEPRHACPALRCRADPRQAQPRRATPAMPSRAKPPQDGPCLPRRDQSGLASPYRAVPALPLRAVPHRATPRRSRPRLPCLRLSSAVRRRPEPSGDDQPNASPARPQTTPAGTCICSRRASVRASASASSTARRSGYSSTSPIGRYPPSAVRSMDSDTHVGRHRVGDMHRDQRPDLPGCGTAHQLPHHPISAPMQMGLRILARPLHRFGWVDPTFIVAQLYQFVADRVRPVTH